MKTKTQLKNKKGYRAILGVVMVLGVLTASPIDSNAQVSVLDNISNLIPNKKLQTKAVDSIVKVPVTDITKNPLDSLIPDKVVPKNPYDDILDKETGTVKPPSTIVDTIKDNQSVPKKGEYTFSGDNLKDSKGKVVKGLWKKILTGKHKDVQAKVKEQAKEDFKETKIEGSMNYTSGKTSIWTQYKKDPNLQYLLSKETQTKVVLSDGKDKYTIMIPTIGKKEQNEKRIKNSQEMLLKYRKAVLDAITLESVNNTYSIFTMYPDKQVTLSEMQEQGVKDGKHDGVWTNITPKNGAKVRYRMSKGINPIFGPIKPSEIKNIGTTKTSQSKYWRGKRDSMSVKVTDNKKGMIQYKRTADWNEFAKQKSETGTLTKMQKAMPKGESELVFESAFTGDKAKSQGKLDTTTYFAVPKEFNLKAVTKQYQLNTDQSAYHVFDDIRLDITKHKVLSYKDGETEELGDFANYGLNPKYLSYTATKVAKTDKKAGLTKGQIVGSIVSLQYKEGVYAPDGVKRNKYYTGRKITLNNDYTGKVELDTPNVSILSVKSDDTGKTGIAMDKFAFMPGLDVKDASAHKQVEGSPTKFEIIIDFEDEKDVRGFVIYRNNALLNDKVLLKWLKTKKAKAMTDVHSDELYELITGKLSEGEKELTYKEWDRLQEMKDELEVSPLTIVRKYLTILSIAFGYVLCMYAVLLCLTWLFDVVVGEAFGFSMFSFITRKRMYPVSETMSEYICNSEDSSYIYITWGKMLALVLSVTAVGLVFLAVSPITSFIVKVYITLTDLFNITT